MRCTCFIKSDRQVDDGPGSKSETGLEMEEAESKEAT